MKHTCWSVLAATITIAGVFAAPHGQTRTVSTMLGTGAPGYSPTQVNNPYGIVVGPDGALYFCDLTISGFAGSIRRAATSRRSPATERKATAATAVPRRGQR